MKNMIMIVATLLGVALASDSAYAGCYRVGETGYHWYRYCAGPSFLYPHHRRCHHRGCGYR